MGNQPTKECQVPSQSSVPGCTAGPEGGEGGGLSDKNQKVIGSIFSQVVMANEVCFGGRLAPWGDYKYELDCDWGVVKSAMWKRRLAPFYTPLEEDPGTDDVMEIEAVLKRRGLHAVVADKTTLWEQKDEDVDDHRIHMSSNSRKRRDLKFIKMKAKDKAWQLQKEQEAIFQKGHVGKGTLELYLNGEECPICFLYYPAKLNVTGCCHQRVCTECFVQMKRLPPHVSEGESDVLVSSPVRCPFCASEPFTVCFESTPVSPDDIRPKWEAQMVATQKRRLRRAAAATLLHANSIASTGLEDRIVAETLKLSLLDK